MGIKHLILVQRGTSTLFGCGTPIRQLTRAAMLFSVIVLVGSLAIDRAVASVLVNGNVVPSDNPFTPLNEGLPDGNFINPFETGPDPLNPVYSAVLQSQFEFIGLRDEDGNLDVPLPIVPGIGPSIIVGRTSFGVVLIDGESAIRSENLVIGDEGIINGGSSQPVKGTGVVRITGFGSLYNNNPFLLPFDDPPFSEFSTIRVFADGYDLYVGRNGTGTLEISAGARAEIQDAVVVGDQPGSTGTILVDGFDSFLGSGGFEGSAAGDPHIMYIGREGIGFMTIGNGGHVLAEAPIGGSGANMINYGASIGADIPEASTRPEFGGQGTVTVAGLGSKWTIGGSLQVGGFHDSSGGVGGGDDVAGEFTDYRPEAGAGILNVEAGGFVNLRPNIGASEQDDLRLAIGRFGRVHLNGGSINIGNVGDPPREENAQLINDGLIRGSGRIDTGIFRNRYLGEVRVGTAEKLLIVAAAEVGATPELEDEPLVNFGRIEAFGSFDSPAEIEFERSPGTETQPLRPFLNLRVAPPAIAPNDFYGGIITAQNSILRFRSDIVNEGMIAFTAGNNYVTGDVINFDPNPDPAVTNDEGIIFISDDAKVVFENDYIGAGGSLIIQPGGDLEVLARNSFVTAGNLSVGLSPTEWSHIDVVGDVGIAGKLTVSLSGFAPGSLSVGDSFEIISFGGDIGGVNFDDPLRPRPDFGAPPAFTELQLASLASLGLPVNAVLAPVFTSNSVSVSVILAAGITTVVGDYNGNGVVDAADYIIWRKNVGSSTVLPNDPYGGIIGATQYNTWVANFGEIAGGPGGGSLGIVPEPTGLGLLFIGGMLALACRRPRQAAG
jgi:hypothetical protein